MSRRWSWMVLGAVVKTAVPLALLAAGLGGARRVEGQAAATAEAVPLEETANTLQGIHYSILVPKGTTATDAGFFHNYSDLQRLITVQVLWSPKSVGTLDEAVAESTMLGEKLIEKQEMAKKAYLVVTSAHGTARARVFREPPGQQGLRATCFSPKADVGILKEMCASLKVRGSERAKPTAR